MMHKSNKAELGGWISKHVFHIAWTVLVLSVLISVFARAPFGFFDEQIHYFRALGVETGQLLSYSKDNDNSRIGHDISVANLEYVDSKVGKSDLYVETGWLSSDLGIEQDREEKQYRVNTSAAAYMPVPYMPYAAAAKLAEVTSVNLQYELVLMRLFGAVLALGMVFAAFKVAPKKYKWTVLAVALVPMSIAAFAAVTTDGFTIASVLLFMAALLRLVERIQNRNLRWIDITTLAVAAVVVATAKMPTFLIIALILGVIVVFWRALHSRHKIYLFSVIGLTAIITLLWAYYAKDINTGAFWGRDVSTIEQLRYIASEPVTFAKNLTYSMLNYDYSNVTYNLYANKDVYTSLPFVVDFIVLIGLALSSFITPKQKAPSHQQKKIYWMQVILFVLAVGAVFVLLYLQFTPIGTPNKIEGMQPRYFLPFLPLLVMIPYVLRLSKKWRLFVYIAPFIGVAFYLAYILVQLV